MSRDLEIDDQLQFIYAIIYLSHNDLFATETIASGEKEMKRKNKREREEETISEEFAAIAKNAEGLVGSRRFTRSALLLSSRSRRSTVLLAKGRGARPRSHGFG